MIDLSDAQIIIGTLLLVVLFVVSYWLMYSGRKQRPKRPWCDECLTHHWPFEGHFDEDIW